MIERINDLEHLEDLLSEPTSLAIEAMGRLEGDLILLGVAGKMGPTLARMARRASDQAGVQRKIYGVARFTDGAAVANRLREQGIEPLAGDLLEPGFLRSLPDVPNVIAMTGMKFGATGQEGRTWAMNVYLPGMICERFARSRLVAFSSGNIYGLCPLHRAGSLESDELHPVGEYAQTCVGRERILQHFSQTLHIPMAILRLNYAVEMRYGVLVDVAQKVLAGQPIDLSMGHLNAIWQADANAAALCAFDHLESPPFIVNLAGPELLSVRRVAEQFGKLFDKSVQFHGSEGPDAVLSNGQLGHRLFGYPRIGANELIHLIADWLQHDGATLGKPTHFEVRDGRF